jgi:choline dehydrogenase-like flavoprotein
MIKDLHEFDEGACVSADIYIIGTGAAGITVARECLGSHLSVVVLEGGGLDNEAVIQQLNEGEVVGLPHAGIEKGRVRAIGGSTIAWGGQNLRLNAFDFERRSWVPNSGWPISLQDIEPYYERAERVLQLGPNIVPGSLCSGRNRTPGLRSRQALRRVFSVESLSQFWNDIPQRS